MRPLVYFDIAARASNMQEGMTISLPIMARLMRNLHGYFTQNPDKFAVAFPRLRQGEFRHPGNIIRIFAETCEDFTGLVEWVTNNPRVAPYVRKYDPRLVKEQEIIGWVEYRRYRVPSKNSRLEACRKYRYMSSEKIPYLRISSSSGESFSMHILAIEGSKTENCSPTSYGLSGANRFSLPKIK